MFQRVTILDVQSSVGRLMRIHAIIGNVGGQISAYRSGWRLSSHLWGLAAVLHCLNMLWQRGLWACKTNHRSGARLRIYAGQRE